MSRDKQIDEMAKDLCHTETCEIKKIGIPCNHRCKAHIYATRAIDKGYAKASEIAREIFEEMREELVRYLMLNENIAIKCKDENGEWNAEYWKGKLSAFKQIQGFIDAELKKKYTEEGK